ncbi:hypothetical protein QR98_0060690 [Sarcoptes scabiei]|uniref:NodB homology domain-containing protein n=1 Tax=Sarcoptes scabiei TaxID=52283 RepID=A0A132A9E2_SARSC|nr:hypothetical protein QR98_0060690 [Sarcoptes scabiei]
MFEKRTKSKLKSNPSNTSRKNDPFNKPKKSNKNNNRIKNDNEKTNYFVTNRDAKTISTIEESDGRHSNPLDNELRDPRPNIFINSDADPFSSHSLNDEDFDILRKALPKLNTIAEEDGGEAASIVSPISSQQLRRSIPQIFNVSNVYQNPMHFRSQSNFFANDFGRPASKPSYHWSFNPNAILNLTSRFTTTTSPPLLHSGTRVQSSSSSSSVSLPTSTTPKTITRQRPTAEPKSHKTNNNNFIELPQSNLYSNHYSELHFDQISQQNLPKTSKSTPTPSSPTLITSVDLSSYERPIIRSSTFSFPTSTTSAPMFRFESNQSNNLTSRFPSTTAKATTPEHRSIEYHFVDDYPRQSVPTNPSSPSPSISRSSSAIPIVVVNDEDRKPQPRRRNKARQKNQKESQRQNQQQQSRCDENKCQLPYCRCGSSSIPGGFDAKEIPQMVMITFDDSINDLNWDLYQEIFSNRYNPNGCPILGTFYLSHEWTDYSQVQNLYAAGHEMASHTITHSFGSKFSKEKWLNEVNGEREIMSLYGGVKYEDVRGMRAPFLQPGGNKQFEMLYEANFTYDSSLPVFDNNPPFWPYTFDYPINHECMIEPCPTRTFPGLWEVGMVMLIDHRGGRCSMVDACSHPSTEDEVFEVLLRNFNRHYRKNKAPFGLYFHSAWFNTQHHKRGFLKLIDHIGKNPDVWFVTKWQLIQWMQQPTPNRHLNSFRPFHCDYSDREPCPRPKVCSTKFRDGPRYLKTCQKCPKYYPWVGKTGFSR